jgi:hypothetical protein
MSQKSVFCIAESEPQAVQIVQQLKNAGFSHQDISVLFPDRQGTRDFAHEQKTKAPEGAVTGASTGGVLGGALGWLAGLGMLAIPGIGPVIAAGPLLAALSGVAVGAAVGGITGALVGMGIPEYEAKRYEGKIRGGNLLISVHTEAANSADKARTIFQQAGAADIAVSGEVRPKEPSAKSRKRAAESAGTRPHAAPPVPAQPRQKATLVESDFHELAPQEVAARAYQIYLEKGRPEGRDQENWLEAERQLLAESRKSAGVSRR